jgi:hypothetical protein
MNRVRGAMLFIFLAALLWPMAGMAQAMTGLRWDSEHTRNAKPTFVRAGIGLPDLGASNDFPLYYFKIKPAHDEATGRA